MSGNLRRLYDLANATALRVQDIATQINDHLDRNENDQAIALRSDLDKAKKDADEASQLYLSMVAASQGEGGDPAQRFVPMGGDTEPPQVRDLRGSREYVQEFFQALKVGASPKSILGGMHRAENFGRLLNALTETGGSPAGSEGGFLLPIDFDNMIKELQRQAVDLAPYVNVEEVTAYSGWRAVETAKAALPFTAINEADFPSGERIPAMESPTFTKVEYTVVNYGGYLPISNDLLSDTPANIMAYLARWCGRKVSLTNTSLILALINALSPTAVTDHKTTLTAIKTALNKTLDPAISASASIFTNQSGLEVMDQLDDGTGRPLLQPDPSSATEFRVKGRPVVVLSDAQWANLGTPTRARIAIGDGRQFATYFRRSALEMATTAIGGTAWRNNNTELRAILRAVAKTIDSGAMKLLAVTLP